MDAIAGELRRLVAACDSTPAGHVRDAADAALAEWLFEHRKLILALFQDCPGRRMRQLLDDEFWRIDADAMGIAD